MPDFGRAVLCTGVLCLRARRFAGQGRGSEVFLAVGRKALNQKAGISGEGGETIWPL